MGYKVILSPDAAKAFKKLDKPIQQRIAVLVDKIEASINPRFSGKALKPNFNSRAAHFNSSQL